MLEDGANGLPKQLEVVELEFTDAHPFMTLNGTMRLMKPSQLLGSLTLQEEKLQAALRSSLMNLSTENQELASNGLKPILRILTSQTLFSLVMS
jgi:hypothetical protein